MDQCLVNLLSTLTSVSEILEGVPDYARGLDLDSLPRQIELLEQKAAVARRDYETIYKKYLPTFGKPWLDTKADLTTESNQALAQMNYNDTALRNLLFVEKRGLFAKRPKAEDYNRFCNAAWQTERIYRRLAKMLDEYRKARLLDTPESVGVISDTYQRVVRNRSDNEAEWAAYPNRIAGVEEIYLGELMAPVDNLELKGLESLGMIEVQNADEAWLKLPYSYNVNEPFSLFISYEGDVKKGLEQTGNMLRSIIYQTIRAMPSYGCQFIYLDPSLGGSTLQELSSALQKAVDGNAYRLHEDLYPDHVFQMFRVGTSNDEASELLKEQDTRVGRINAVCGARTVTEFNAGKFGDDGLIREDCNDVIPHQVVIFENVHNNLSDSQARVLRKLADTAKKCGISIILTSVRNTNEPLTAEEQMLLRNEPRAFDRISIDRDGADVEFSGAMLGDDPDKSLFFNFEPDCAPISHGAYVESVRIQFTPDLNVETFLDKRIDIDAEFGQYYAENEITIPVAVNNRNQVVSLGIGATDGTHFMVAGETNCGKSSYLHTIINGIIMRYKPTDVQMWLWDYKEAEFDCYAKHTPPHITCVGSGTSMERTFGFLDLISAEFERRKKLYVNAGVTDMEGYRKRKGPDSLPRILIIIDEFHVMSNHVRENEEYKRMLTSLFREMRYVGMLFLLSDQTCYNGLQGLTDDARQQISGRMAMRTKPAEYNAVFDISNSNEVIPVQARFEVTIARTGKRLDTLGRAENFVFYEHCKTLYIPPEIRRELVQKSIEAYGACDSLQVYSDPKRCPADWQAIRSEMRTNQHISAFGDDEEDVEESTVPVYLGTPTTMERHFHFDLVKNYGQNVISVVTDHQIHASMLMHAVESVRMCDDYEIYVISRKHDTVLKICRRWLREQADRDPRIHLVTDMGECCSTIVSLYDTMAKRRRRPSGKKIFIFWLGLFDMIREMEYYPQNRPSAQETKKDAPQNSLSSLDSMFADLFGAMPGISMPSDPVMDDDDEDDRLYNAAEDIASLVADGPNCGMHNFVLYSAAAIAKKSRKIVSLDDNNHRIALGIGKDDAADIVGSARNIMMANGKPVPEEMAVYYDGLRPTQFLPFTSEINGVVL